MIDSNIPPREVLLKKYILPSGKSISKWAIDCGIVPRHLRDILKGVYLFTIPFSVKLATVTNTNPRFWIRIQMNYLLNKFQATLKYKTILKIESIGKKPKHYPRYPGEVLDKIIKSKLKISYAQLARCLNTKEPTLDSIIKGYARIDFKHAIRLGAVLGTGSLYWLDLQAKQDLQEYVITREPAYTALGKAWTINSKNKLATRLKHIHPGKILLNRFIEPSGINKSTWAKYFCVTPTKLYRLLKGKVLLDISLIAMISKAFGTKPVFWIELQNRYLANHFEKKILKKYKIKPLKVSHTLKKETRSVFVVLPPGQILINNYLKPMNWGIQEFGRHIGFSENSILSIIKGKKKIDAELACLLSHVLGTSPMFWLDLQVDWDFFKSSKLKTKK